MMGDEKDHCDLGVEFRLHKLKTEMQIKIMWGLVALSNGDALLSILKGVMI